MISRSKLSCKKRRIAAILGVIICSFLSSQSLAMNPRDMLTDIYDRQGLTGKGSFELNLKIVSYRGKANNISTIRVLFYDGKKQLVTFTSPERLKDDYFLVNGYNTWMYQKGLQRPIRISAQQKIFGDAGIAETAGINYLDDYEIVRTIESDGDYQMDLKAKDSRTAYQHASIWISKENRRIARIVLKGMNDQALKSLQYSDYTFVDGHEIAKIQISNLLQQQDQKTIMEFTSIINRTFSTEIFDPLMMGKIRL